MGQRANFVLIRGGQRRLFYDHWAANRLDVELFWGPELAARFIEQLRCVEFVPESWLDEVWCEGGAVLDEDARVLLWFGGEDVEQDVPRRRALLALMRRPWQGWDVRWAAGHVAELGAYVGVPTATFLVEGKASLHPFEIDAEYPEANDTLLTVRRQGRVFVAKVRGGVDSLQLGVSQLDTLLALANSSELDWAGDPPTAGVHVDLDARRLCFWLARSTCVSAERVGATWPGWELRWLRDDYDAHLALAGSAVRLALPALKALYAANLQFLRRCHTHRANNPARAAAERLGAGQINPWSDAAAGSVGTGDAKLRLLDALCDELGIAHSEV